MTTIDYAKHTGAPAYVKLAVNFGRNIRKFVDKNEEIVSKYSNGTIS